MRQALCRARIKNRCFILLTHVIKAFSVVCLLLAFSGEVLLQQAAAQDGGGGSRRIPLPLEPGLALEEEIAGAELHIFSMQVPAGHFVRVSVNQRGAVLNSKVIAPNGATLLEGVTPNALSDIAFVSLVSQDAGEYRLEISHVRKETPRRKYAIKIDDIRSAKSEDQDRAVADRLVMEAGSLIAFMNANNLRAAIDKYRSALDLWRKIGAQTDEAQTLLSLGSIANNLSQPSAALDYYKQSLAVWRIVKDSRKEAQTLSAMGWTYFGTGDFANARENYNLALPIRQKLNDLKGQAQTLTTLGQVDSALGDSRHAIENYTQGLSLARQADDKLQQAFALNNFGYMYGNLGDYQKGLDCLGEAVTLWKETGNKYGEADALNSAGIIYDRLGDFERGMEHYEQALKIWRFLGYRGGEADALNNLASAILDKAILLERNEDLETALDYLKQALKIRRAINQGFGEESTLLSLGVTYQYLGQTDKALEYFNEVLAKHPKHFLAFHNIGFNYFQRNDNSRAIEYLKQALAIERERQFSEAEALTLRLLAGAQMELGQLQESVDNVRKAIEILEKSRAPVLNPEIRMLHRGRNASYLLVLIDVLSRLHALHPKDGYDQQAFEVTEQGRARGLVEMLLEARVDLDKDVEPNALAREHSLELQLNAKEQYRARLAAVKGKEAELSAVESELRSLETQYKEARTLLLRSNPKYAALTQPKTLTVKETQALIGHDGLLLEYRLGQEKSYLWAISSNTSSLKILPGRQSIQTQARRVYDLLTARNLHVPGETAAQRSARVTKADADFKTTAATLSETLLGPVSSILGKKRLIIISDGLLQYIPFGALPTPGGNQEAPKAAKVDSPLMFDHEIVNLPSVSVLEVLRRELANRPAPINTVAVIADPVYSKDDPRVRTETTNDGSVPTTRYPEPETENGLASGESEAVRYRRLRFSRDEARAISAFVPAASSFAALDFKASKETVINSNLSQYRILHFASHGVLDTQRPELSGLALSFIDEKGQTLDGYLRLNDIYKLKLNADLVVLSGCQTALGKDLKGEGLIGLTRGFMYAGVQRVIASLWNVDDRATSELMRRFYRGFLVQKLPAAAALREAQKSMFRERGWSAPYYWAPFTLQGEWK